ncbi:MAG: arylmalonate decarboxylase [Rhodospirillaceae bacterium]|nr:arylmalonate decarboxylase [Rhodospirillaceae bacterium]
MVDSLGYRMKFGVIAPSTNTSVEPEYALMQPRGVTNHFGRIAIPDDPVRNDKEFEQLLVNIRSATVDALDVVMSCSPGYVIMGMSAETFWDGAGGAEKLKKKMEKRAGVTVSLGSHACEAALNTYEKLTKKKIKKIAVLTPYMPVGDKNVRKFFTDNGYEVISLIGLKSPSPMLIAHEPPEKLRKAIIELNASNPDAIVQVGTNLACNTVAEEAERWLNKPVVAINAATYWYSLRDAGIKDQMQGHGRLLAEA